MKFYGTTVGIFNTIFIYHGEPNFGNTHLVPVIYFGFQLIVNFIHHLQTPKPLIKLDALRNPERYANRNSRFDNIK